MNSNHTKVGSCHHLEGCVAAYLIDVKRASQRVCNGWEGERGRRVKQMSLNHIKGRSFHCLAGCVVRRGSQLVC